VTSTLALHVNATAIITAYQQTCADIRTHFAGLVESEKRLNLALGCEDHYAMGAIRIVPARHSDGANFDRPEDAICRLRKKVWDTIVERLELRKFLSVAKWSLLQKQIEADELPDITHESVGQFAAGLLDMRQELLQDAVKEVFERLRPRGYGRAAQYKSNSELEVGPRVVLTNMVESNHVGGLRVCYHTEQELLAMERVFQMLDGRGEISKAHYSEISIAMKGGARMGETPYFAWRAFSNRNLHVRFTRLDLLKRFNEIAGGKRLRPEKRRPVADADAIVQHGESS
jgi:hypothetical protein